MPGSGKGFASDLCESRVPYLYMESETLPETLFQEFTNQGSERSQFSFVRCGSSRATRNSPIWHEASEALILFGDRRERRNHADYRCAEEMSYDLPQPMAPCFFTETLISCLERHCAPNVRCDRCTLSSTNLASRGAQIEHIYVTDEGS